MEFANMKGDFSDDLLWEQCEEYFNLLADQLKDTHEVVASCNYDDSKYLVPKGTANQITYSSKPVNSYRLSDHWNWKANLKKNPDENYIQCYSRDMPWCKQRLGYQGHASRPIRAYMVARFDKDNKYHHVFGEKFNRKTKEWTWGLTNDAKR